MPSDKYLRKIKAAISCSKDTKKELMKIIKNDIDAFLLECPDATENDIINKFGSPDELAKSYLASLDISEVNSQLRKIKSVKQIVISSICIVILIILVLFVGIYLYCNEEPTYVNEGPRIPGEPYVIVRYYR